MILIAWVAKTSPACLRVVREAAAGYAFAAVGRYQPQRLSVEAQGLFNDSGNELCFSAVSIWEVAIKRGLDRSDFQLDVRQFRRGLIDNGYIELPMSSLHAVAIDLLPAVHRDPFDRMLVAQASVEGFPLITSDAVLAQYSGLVRLV